MTHLIPLKFGKYKMHLKITVIMQLLQPKWMFLRPKGEGREADRHSYDGKNKKKRKTHVGAQIKTRLQHCDHFAQKLIFVHVQGLVKFKAKCSILPHCVKLRLTVKKTSRESLISLMDL